MFYLILPSPAARHALMEHLTARGIASMFHYVPLHASRMGRKFAAAPAGCPITSDVSKRLLRLPFFNDLAESDQEQVIAAIQEWRVDADQTGAGTETANRGETLTRTHRGG